MPQRSTPLPDELGAVFSTSEAHLAGVTKARLARSDLVRGFRGVYFRRSTEPVRGVGPLHPAGLWRAEQLRSAAMLAPYLPPGHFFCGYTTAVIWELPVPPSRSGDLEVACFSPARASRRAGVRGFRIKEGFARATIRLGLPVADAVSTWCMLAPRLPWDDGIALGDGVIGGPGSPAPRP